MRVRLVYTLSLWLLATVGISVLAMGGVTAWNLREGFSTYLQARDVERLEKFAQLVAERVGEAGVLAALEERGRVDMPLLLRELRRREGLSANETATPRGERPPFRGPPGANQPPPPGPPPGPGPRPRPRPEDPFGDRVGLFAVDGRQLEGPAIVRGDVPLVERPVSVQGTVVALLRMRPANPIPDEIDVRFLRRQYQGIAAVAAALILLALASAWWLARRWAGPLAAVTQATARIAQGELTIRLPEAQNDEIGDVVRNVNLMAESLQKMEGARRRWIADMSHELRTPLTALRGEIEALVDGIRPLNRDAMTSLREDVLRLGALIDDLHLLAMSDLRSLPCRLVETDAVVIVTDAIERFGRRASTAGLSLGWAASPPGVMPVNWDPARIEQLLSNLLENSLRYTDAPGRIALGLERNGETVRLTVEDSSPGVAAADLQRLFEPLYRGDSARGRNTGGSGLGLAICEAIVGAHGGRIRAEQASLGGLRVTVEIPVDAGSAGLSHG